MIGGAEVAARKKAGYMISAVAEIYDVHPQTLRLYERLGLLKPSRSDGNTRLYIDSDLKRLETILNLTRDLGVNLAGVEVILDMREKMARMQQEMAEMLLYVRENLASGEGMPKRGALIRVPASTIIRRRG
jgi:MerR family transcriptional regulator/heat shock protein HspR